MRPMQTPKQQGRLRANGPKRQVALPLRKKPIHSRKERGNTPVFKPALPCKIPVSEKTSALDDLAKPRASLHPLV